ncbi:MAG: universal stress protein [Beijerinckiaceae bacterium]
MRTRRAYEPGHRPKLLVVVDETQEADRALYFASRRAARMGSGLVMLTVMDPGETQVWLGVGDIMKAEAEEKANALLDKAAARVREIAGVEAERLVGEGSPLAELNRVIDEDEDIAVLVLAAGVGQDGPGPIVTSVAAKGGMNFAIPVTIVPGSLKDSEIDALAG